MVKLETEKIHWQNFSDIQANDTIFHHPNWLSILEETYNYKPFWILNKDNLGKITAGLPIIEVSIPFLGKRWVSLPFTDYCPPIYTQENDLQGILEYLIKAIEEKTLKNIEIRFPIKYFKKNVHQKNLFVWHVLQLNADPDIVFNTFRKKGVIYEIKKAKRDGVEVKLCSSKKEFENFYNLQLKTRKKLGSPIQPKRFFKLIWDHLIETDMGFVLIAYKNKIPLASSVFLRYKTTITYKYSASDPNYIRFSPNHAVLWEAIRWACINGFKIFDFGKTQIKHIGLRNFKDGWGAREHMLPYSYIGSAPLTLKDGLLQRLGSSIIRNSPLIVCRSIGETLYKYLG